MLKTEKLQLEIRNMTIDDVAEVRALEKICFSESWPEGSFLREVQNTRTACYIVARLDNRLVGYMGAWVIMDEAHITTIGVDPEFRGLSIGKFLVWNLLQKAIQRNCRWATLEVGVRNYAAIKTYEAFSFITIGKRNNYYENGDDALVMWAGNIQGKIFKEKMDKIKSELEEKICWYSV